MSGDVQLDLFAETHPVVTAHCFFQARCTHTVTGFDPHEVHEQMETHYNSAHAKQIDFLLGPIHIPSPGRWWTR